MKTIRTLGFFLVLATISLGLVACREEEKRESRLKELILKDFAFPSSSSSETMTFRNEDMHYYKATSSDESWCRATIDVISSSITVYADENTTYDQREATITLSDVDYPTITRTFKVTQAQKDGLFVGTTSFEIPMEGKEIGIEVQSNVPYTVEIAEDTKDWVSLVQSAGTRGLETSTIQLKVAKNSSGNMRKGSVKIKNSKTNDVITVSIEQAFSVVFKVEPTNFTIDELGGIIEVKVNTNIGCDVYPQVDWISKLNIEEIDEDNYIQKLRVAPFTEKRRGRSGVIIFENVHFSTDVDVTVTQTRALFIEESEIRVIVGGRKSLELYNSTGEDPVWTSSNEKIAKVTKEGVVVGVSDGMATITVTSADGKHTDSATVQVDKTADLSGDLTHTWQESLDANGVLASVSSTFTNKNAENDIIVTQCAFYRDSYESTPIGIVSYNSTSGLVKKSGGSLDVKFDVPAPDPADTATHTYYIVWTYTYNNSTFTYIGTK